MHTEISEKSVASLNKLTSTKSEQLVAQKFIRDFENVYGVVMPADGDYLVDYMKLGEIMRRLQFLHNDNDFQNPKAGEQRSLLYDMWYILRGEEINGVTKRNLCQFLLTLIGISSFRLKGEEKLPQYQ